MANRETPRSSPASASAPRQQVTPVFNQTSNNVIPSSVNINGTIYDIDGTIGDAKVENCGMCYFLLPDGSTSGKQINSTTNGDCSGWKSACSTSGGTPAGGIVVTKSSKSNISSTTWTVGVVVVGVAAIIAILIFVK